MFYGYITLARRMKDECIQLNKLFEIIKCIDFSRQNKVWIESDILNQSQKISKSIKKQIYKFFNDIDLSKYQEGG
jgi:hypothetical protein